MSTNETEIPLNGGQSAIEVVRKGNTVCRTPSENAGYVHSLLRFLEQNNFPYAPRFLGIDAQQREVLSFLPGEVPREIECTFSQIKEAVTILRQLHDLCAGTDLADDQETVCHHDFAPWNVIVHEGAVSGVIDFDEAAPGRRVEDLAYCIWTFLDLGVADKPATEQVSELAQLVDTYGLEDRAGFIHALLRQQQRILHFREAVVSSGEDEQLVAFSKGAVARIKQSIDWVQRQEAAILAAILK